MTITVVLNYFVIGLTLLTLAAWRAVGYFQMAGYWTLCLRWAPAEPYLLTIWALSSSSAMIRFLLILYNESAVRSLFSNPHLNFLRHLIVLVIGIIIISMVEFCYKNLKNISYLRLRWKAWSGPSRTGIPSGMAQYIGSKDDWKFMARQVSGISYDPIDRFPGWFGKSNTKIIWDPTSMLQARALLEKDLVLARLPQAQEKDGIYQPISGNSSISLLWGEGLGFERRCSRGIISVPPYLLTASPKIPSGISGKALCLAYAILSRNKGLEPRSLICNLKNKNSFRDWEEAGIWPHPAKTLRSFYHSELNSAFSLLGESYVTSVTELALLLADLDHSHIEYWLDNEFEQQDLDFNRLVHAQGGSASDLDRLYRGHYAAMLISLNLISSRPSIRPELAVFEAVCVLEKVPAPGWIASPAIQARRDAELQAYGSSLFRVVQAVI